MRNAPRRSPRPRTRLRLAMKPAAAISTTVRPRNVICLARLAFGQADTSIRSGFVQGAITSNQTGRPRYAAASTRIGRSGRSGQAPSQAARASVWNSGVHRGVTGRKAAGSSRASENRRAQSGDGTVGGASPSSCGGIA